MRDISVSFAFRVCFFSLSLSLSLFRFIYIPVRTNCIQMECLKDDVVFGCCVINHAVLCVPPYEDILGVMKTGAKKGLFDDDVSCTEVLYRKIRIYMFRYYQIFFPHRCAVSDD